LSKRILIIDDEEMIRSFLAKFLASLSIETETVSTGHDALRATYESNFMLIVMDFQLDDMEGSELYAALRKQAPTTPVLISSGYPDNREIQNLTKQARTDFISKPFKLDAIRIKIEELSGTSL
jgi:DNA-binding NtrC family response regulator